MPFAAVLNRYLFPAPTPTYHSDLPGLIYVPHPRGSFPALMISPPYSPPTTLLYFHCNGQDIGDSAPLLYRLAGCFNVKILAIEYPGYGLAWRLPVDPALIEEWGVAAAHWLLRDGLDPAQLFLFGSSIGTGPAARVAVLLKKMSRLTIGGLVLQSPYTSIRDLAAEYGLCIPCIIPNYWDIRRDLQKLAPNTPLMIVHGKSDRIIPVRHGMQLYATYDCTPHYKHGIFLEGQDHNVITPSLLVGPMREFLTRHAKQDTTKRKRIATLF